MKSQHRARLAKIVDVVFGGNEAEAARAAGVPQQTLNRILTGKVKDPSASTLQKLAEAFGVPTAWLLGEGPSHLGNAATPNWYFLLKRYYYASTASDTAWLKRARAESPEVKKAIEFAKSTDLRLVCTSWVMDTDLRATTPRAERRHIEAVRATFEALRRDQQFAVATLKARPDVTAERS